MPFKEVINWKFDETSGVRKDSSDSGFDLTVEGLEGVFESIETSRGTALKINNVIGGAENYLAYRNAVPARYYVDPQDENLNFLLTFSVQFPDIADESYAQATIKLSDTDYFSILLQVSKYTIYESDVKSVILAGHEFYFFDNDFHDFSVTLTDGVVTVTIDDVPQEGFTALYSPGSIIQTDEVIGITSYAYAEGSAHIILKDFSLSCHTPPDAPSTTPDMTDPELALHWTMDEESGTRVDVSGNGYDISREGPSGREPEVVPGYLNNAIKYEKREDLYPEAPWADALVSAEKEAVPVTGPYKWEMRLRFSKNDSVTVLAAQVFLMIDSFASNSVIMYDSKLTPEEDDKIRMTRWTGAYDSVAFEFENDEEYHHLEIVSLDGFYENIYVDGALMNESQFITKSIRDAFIDGVVGVQPLGNSFAADGEWIELDEIKFWTFTYSPEPPPPPPPPPVQRRRINVGFYNAYRNLNPGAVKGIGVGYIEPEEEEL